MFNKDKSKNISIPNIPSLDAENSQKFFGIILTILALSFFGFFAIKPTVSTIVKLNKEIEDNESVLTEQEEKINSLNQLAVKYRKLEKDIPVVTNAIPIKPEATLLFGQIQFLAKDSGITVISMQELAIPFVQVGSEEKYYSYNFEVVGTGSLEDLYKFTQRLTNIERVIGIKSFMLYYVKNQDQSGLQVTIQGTAYFMK